jgi:tRNA-dihydrouridine synthase
MDGVTDAAYRYMADTHGPPHLLMTEFTNAEGIAAGATKILWAFVYHDTQTPTIAQIFGADPEAFYKATFVVLAMGFDGIDINMGCPDKNVARHGGGAGLIRDPKRAQQIVRKTKQAVQDWADGRRIEDVGLKNRVIQWVKRYKEEQGRVKLYDTENASPDLQTATYNLPPVSVKTRMGYDEIITEGWMNTLLETEPAAISLHGRTLKQMYTGQANWEEIGKAAKVVKQTGIPFLGNGDVQSLEDAYEKIKTYGTDGVLIGRAAFGNPWLFQNREPTVQERFDAMLEHCQAFDRLTPELNFLSLRKHLGWYCKHFPHAGQVRTVLMQTKNTQEVNEVLKKCR